MSEHFHAIVWIDHREAKIFEFGADDVERVVAALAHNGAILITGPAQARLELKNYISEHGPELAQRISGVEALDHTSDSALVALTRKFFRADDRMHSQAQTH